MTFWDQWLPSTFGKIEISDLFRDSLSDFLVERGLQFVDGIFEIGFAAKLFDELYRHAHFIEWRYFQNFYIVQTGATPSS